METDSDSDPDPSFNLETEEAIAELGFTGDFEGELVINEMAEACRNPAKQQKPN
jgi:hypothetical protein